MEKGRDNSMSLSTMPRYDVAIVGSGPAGLEAAITLKIRKKNFLLFGTEILSRKLLTAPHVDNYLGLPRVSGKELQEHFLSHIRQMGIEVHPQQVQMIYAMGDHFALAAGEAIHEAATVILATGSAHAKPLPGEEALLGRGVSYCATCDAPLYRGKRVAVLGYTEEAVHEANFLAEVASHVYYIPMEETQTPLVKSIEVLGGKAKGIVGDPVVRGVSLDSGEIDVDGVFILRDAVAPTSLMPGIEMNGGFIRVGHDMETSIPGCFAAGDCTGAPHQFMRAAGQGQIAAHSVINYLHKAT